METKDDKKELPQYLFEEHYKSQASHLARLSEKTLLVERNLYSIFLATSTSTPAILIGLRGLQSQSTVCQMVYLLVLLLFLLSAVSLSILLYSSTKELDRYRKMFRDELISAAKEGREIEPQACNPPHYYERLKKTAMILYFLAYAGLFVYAALSSFNCRLNLVSHPYRLSLNRNEKFSLFLLRISSQGERQVVYSSF